MRPLDDEPFPVAYRGQPTDNKEQEWEGKTDLLNVL